MFVVVEVVELFFELHDGVRSTGGGVTVVAEQAGASQARFTRQVINTVAAELPFDALAVENNGFRRAGAENGGEDAGRKMCVAHAGD